MDVIHDRESAVAGFDAIPFTAAQHLRLALFGVIARVMESCADGGIPTAIEAHPFLAEYLDQLHERTGATESFAAHWWRQVCAWERAAVGRGIHLPLVALRDAGLSGLELELLVAVGLVEEDPRFGDIFEEAHRGERRPTIALLMAWWRDDGSGDDRMDDVRRGVQRLVDYGLLQLRNPDAARAEWVPAAVLPVWDALRGEVPALRWLQHVEVEALPELESYVAPGAMRTACGAMPALLADRPAPVLLLRGPLHNGRKTLAGALARALNRPVLVVREPVFDDEPRWRLLAALAAITGAVPVIDFELALGESRALPPLPLADAPLIVVTGRHGAWTSHDAKTILSIDLPLPGPAERPQHWQACLPPNAAAALPECTEQMRLASGSIRSVAATAMGLARLGGRDAIGAADLRPACRALQSARLETIATRLEATGTLAHLAVDDATRDELDALVARCRWRERLGAESAAIAGGGVGVRALFGGPSGSGKTLASRLLAAELGKEIYRLDLAATVNKYLGETEKNLHRALTAAEELDVLLLIDEGDALLANRTDVGSSNDRYANLETNFLLQRLESFEGILLVTTNTVDRIDRAFARRMDVVVNFRSPDAWRRFEILKLHLEGLEIDHGWLEEAATRCALSGGQLRNAVTHARLLSLNSGRRLDEAHVHAALAREYRKHGASCPLRAPQAKRWP